MLPKLHTVRSASDATGRLISQDRIRRAIAAGELRVARITPGSTSRILISENELERWIVEVLGSPSRQHVLSPSEVARVRREAAQAEAQAH